MKTEQEIRQNMKRIEKALEEGESLSDETVIIGEHKIRLSKWILDENEDITQEQ